MHRRAILLASPETDSIPSVYTDAEAFCSFLRSNPGGAWEAEEVLLQENPTRAQVLAAISAAKNVDYSLVFFAGRGEILKMGLPWPEMRMYLGSGETITERELNTGSPHCSLILDCSYRTPRMDAEKFPVTPSTFLEHGKGASDFRVLYQKGIEGAEGGFVKAYATAVSNAALDTQSFTQHLLSQANGWVATHKGTLYLGDAVTLASEAMKRENAQQRAEYRGGRRLHDFPFAVQI